MPTEKRIVLSAWTHKAKVYPYWIELIGLMEKGGYNIIQVAKKGEEPLVKDCRYDLPLEKLEKLALDIGDFIAVDNFFHHLAHQFKVSGTVIWGPSDSRIFGYGDQINIIKDYKYLRKDQYGFYRDYVWEYAKEGWYGAKEVWDFFTDK